MRECSSFREQFAVSKIRSFDISKKRKFDSEKNLNETESSLLWNFEILLENFADISWKFRENN